MVPTSSVSAAVKRLEQEIGANLFDRTANRITLNKNGRLLAEALGTAFEQVENALVTINNSGVINKEIRMLVKVRRQWITDLVIEYQKSHPEVTFSIANDFQTEDYDHFDVILDEQSDQYGEKERFLLIVEQLCIKAFKESELAGKVLTMRQLKDQPFIMMGSGSALRKLLERTGKRCGFVPRVAIECDDRQCLIHCVEAGMGLMLGSYRALSDPSEADIVPLNVVDFHEIQAIYVYHRRTGAGDQSLKDFLAFLERKAKRDTNIE